MFGNAANPMTFPAATQNTLLGSDLAPPIVPALAVDDSWLTIGANATRSDITSQGLTFTHWASVPLSTSDGGVFYTNPSNGPSGTVLLGKLNTANGNQTATFNLQGDSTGSAQDWRVYGLTVTWTAASPPPPPSPPPGPPGAFTVLPASAFNVSVTTAGANARISVTLPPTVTNVYSMFGLAGNPMSFPAANQLPTGTTLGPAPVLGSPDINAGDSWLTIGASPGQGGISAVGLNLASWSSTTALSTTNGAVVLVDPTTGPSGTVLLGKLNTGAGSQTATFNLQGLSLGGGDWRMYGLTVTWTCTC
jgi:hypothetical protein